MLLAVEADRRDLRNRVATGFEEEIESVAQLHWPFLVAHADGAPGAAIFDLTGVWKQTFRYTFMPSPEKLRALLEEQLSPDELQGRMRSVTESFGSSDAAELLTIEGFLPLTPSLQLELLSQAGVREPSEASRAGYLPTRRKVEWYQSEVGRMRQWLNRLDTDLGALREFRGQVEAIVRSTLARLDQAQAKTEADAHERAGAARRKAYHDLSEVQLAHHQEIQRHLESIGEAQRTVAYGETAVSTSSTLADRAVSRRDDARPHLIRARDARVAIRNARRQIQDNQRAIEAIHQRQRDGQTETMSGLAQVERAGALSLAHHELLRDQIHASTSDLLEAIDAQISARQAQKDTMADSFLPLPAQSSTRIVWLPIWVATFRSPRGVRQIVFPPLKVRSTVGVGGSIKRLFGGMVLPFEPRAAHFDKEFRSTVEAALATDPWLSNSTQELARSANLLTADELLPQLEKGLAELRHKGWISQKHGADYLRTYAERVDHQRSSAVSGPEFDASSEPARGARGVAVAVAAAAAGPVQV